MLVSRVWVHLETGVNHPVSVVLKRKLKAAPESRKCAIHIDLRIILNRLRMKIELILIRSIPTCRNGWRSG